MKARATLETLRRGGALLLAVAMMTGARPVAAGPQYKWDTTWYSLSGKWTSPLAVGRTADGRLELFARGVDAALWHTWQVAQNDVYSDWASLGGMIAAGVTPAVALNADGRLEVFVVGGWDGIMYHRWQDAPNGGWVGWASLGQWWPFWGSPTVGHNANGALELFIRTKNNRLQHLWQDTWFLWTSGISTPPSSWWWTDWYDFGSIPLGVEYGGDPVAVRNADGRLEVFQRGNDASLWHRRQLAATGDWSDWAYLGGTFSGTPAVGQNLDGRLEVFMVSTDGALWHAWQAAANSEQWFGWDALGNPFAISNAAVARNADGRLELFVVGADGNLWARSQVAPNLNWTDWYSLGGGFLVGMKNPAVGQNADGRLEVFVQAQDGSFWTKFQVPG
jgi:hypothetical protein